MGKHIPSPGAERIYVYDAVRSAPKVYNHPGKFASFIFGDMEGGCGGALAGGAIQRRPLCLKLGTQMLVPC